MLVTSVEIRCCYMKKLSNCTSFRIHNGQWQKIQQNLFWKNVRATRFNFLKSKYGDLAAIYQKKPIFAG